MNIEKLFTWLSEHICCYYFIYPPTGVLHWMLCGGCSMCVGCSMCGGCSACVEATVCVEAAVHVWRLQCVCGGYSMCGGCSTCVETAVRVWRLQCVCGGCSACMEAAVRVWRLQYVCIGSRLKLFSFFPSIDTYLRLKMYITMNASNPAQTNNAYLYTCILHTCCLSHW